MPRPSPPTLGKVKTPEFYEDAMLLVEGFLIGAAQARRVVTYREVDSLVVSATGHQIGGRFIGRFLGELVERTFPKYRVVLSALVVNSSSLAPGDGFAPLAVELGLAREGEENAAVVHRLRARVWHRFGS